MAAIVQPVVRKMLNDLECCTSQNRRGSGIVLSFRGDGNPNHLKGAVI